MLDLILVLGVAVVIILVVIGSRARMRPGLDAASRESLLSRPLDPALVTRVRELLGSGKKVQAIKELRYALEVGLAEAKRLVEGIETGEVTGAAPADPPASARPDAAPQPESGPSDLADRARSLRSAGREVDAIRLVCDETGMGILDAQKFVRALD